MSIDISSVYHQLHFKRPSGTSRGVLNTKDSWLLLNQKDGLLRGVGEVSIINGLSIESDADVIQDLKQTPLSLETMLQSETSSIRFGAEILQRSLRGIDPFDLWDSPFRSNGQAIKINGLIWMGEKTFMFNQIKQKLDEGFDCLKLKIGAIDFDQELSLLKYVRTHFSIDQVELRVDANGAFSPAEALSKLKHLSDYGIHSIEQPIKPNQLEEMYNLCQSSPIPIALDEELIGDFQNREMKSQLLETIKPQYIILKPSLIGGFEQADQWIEVANSLGISWWATSALESNIGLNAIAQWVSAKSNDLPQGLGTGQLYTNNINSPLTISNGHLHYDQTKAWDIDYMLSLV